MNTDNSTQQEWTKTIEDALARGQQITIPKVTFNYDTAKDMARRLDIYVVTRSDKYVFKRKQGLGPYLRMQLKNSSGS